MFDVIAANARYRNNDVALVDGPRRATYRQLADRVYRWVSALQDLGVSPGERVAILAHNSQEFFEWYFAVCAGGYVGTPLNFRLTAAELASYLDYVGARVLVTDPALTTLAADAAGRSSSVDFVVGFGAGHGQDLDLDALLARADGAVTLPLVDPDQPALICPTSGTTGTIKGVCISQRNTWAACVTWLSGLGFSAATHRLQAVQTSFATGGPHYAALFVGGKMTMQPAFDAQRVIELIEREGVTQATFPPAMMNQIVELKPSEDQLRSLDAVNVGGAPFDLARFDSALDVFGSRITVAFGLTETSATATMLWPRDYLAPGGDHRRASVGRPWPGVRLRVTDDAGVDVPMDAATVGEIWIGGPTVASGYWEMPDETNAAFVDGWFSTGDLATLDEDGFVYIVDRKKDVIVSGGINVGSLEVEQVIAQHPGVAQVAVIGIPHDRWGEAVHAVVVRRPGTNTDEDEIIMWCRDRLASFKKPQSVEFVDALPTNANGKLLKRELREPHWKGRSSRVG